MKNRQHYIERAHYMRRLAQEALTEPLRKSCLRKAEEYEKLAREAARQEPEKRD